MLKKRHIKNSRLLKDNIKKDIQYALVSVFTNLARIRKVEKKHIDSLAKLFRNTLSYEPSLLELWKIAESPYSLRQSCQIFNNHFAKRDKVILFLNIIYLVYQEDNFHVLSSLEIIKIVDLLYLDISFYEQVLDIIEGKSQHFSLNTDIFFVDLNDRILQNDIIFSKQKNADLYLNNVNLIVLNILNNIFYAFNSQKNDNAVFASNVFNLLADDGFIKIIAQDDLTINLNKAMLLKLYQRKQSKTSFSYLFKHANIELEVDNNGLKTTVKTLSGKYFINNRPARKHEILALDDLIQLEHKHLGFNFVSGEFLQQEKPISKHVLNDVNGKLNLSESGTQNLIPELAQLTFISKNKQNFLILSNINSTYEILVNGVDINNLESLKINDIIEYRGHNYQLNKYFQLEELKQYIHNLQVHELYHEFSKGQKIALDNISFDLKSKEMLAIMGPSGSGKTTFLKCLLGEILPKRINLTINGKKYNPETSSYRQAIAYVPQDDLLFENLTIYQNLYYCAKVRVPDLFSSNEEINLTIDQILSLMGLHDKRNLRAGSLNQKVLSGGERKRLNIALELLSDPQIIILDEPTSGLSSKDSEKLIETLNDLKQIGKIILATIHQPNADLFQQFDKLLLLDKGGIQVYFGKTSQIFSYFDEELAKLNDKKLETKRDLSMPEFLFDILEYNEINHSELIRNIGFKERQFSPIYWKEKYRNNKMLEFLQLDNDTHKDDQKETEQVQHTAKKNYRANVKKNYFLFLRNMINKTANLSYVLVSLLASPILGLIISSILRYVNNAEHESYSLYHNPNIGLFIFISVIIFIFLGMASSINEIISERRILNRERKINVYLIEFFSAKYLFLSLLLLIQSFLYLAFSMPILQIKGVILQYQIFLFLAGLTGVSIGLFLSSLFNNRDSATNLMPYLIIPQILFAGAVISFSELNPYVKINHNRSVPEFCEIISSRWLFEGLAIAQVENNYWDRTISSLNKKIMLTSSYKDKNALYSRKNSFIKSFPAKNYQNEKLNKLVFIQNGRTSNSGYYQFMSSSRIVFGKKVSIILYNISISIFIILFFNSMTLILLKFRQE